MTTLFPSIGDLIAGLVWLGIGIGLGRIARDDWRSFRREPRSDVDPFPPADLPPGFRILEPPYDHRRHDLDA